MIIGLDFDNTIVCYDKAISILAEERFDLPDDLPRTKLAIRDHLRGLGREADWTRFQGELYGPGMVHAEPFENAINVIRELTALEYQLVVISHRTRFPYLGQRHDLHGYAEGWIRERVPPLFASVTFNETKADKIKNIRRAGCSLFVDDLPEVLADPTFPTSTRRILFAPNGVERVWKGERITAWRDLIAVVQAGVAA